VFFIKINFLLILAISILYGTNLTQKEKHWIESNTLYIGTEQWSPIIYHNKKSDKLDGIIGDILNVSFNNLNIKTKIISGSWKDTLNDFKNHKTDLLPALYYTKEREKFGNYSNKIFSLPEYLYIKNSNKYIKNFDNLKGRKLAIIKDYAMIKMVKNKYPTINIVETKDLEQSINFVLDGKVDALIDSQIVVENFILNNIITGIKGFSQNSFKPNDVYLLSNKNKPILKSILQKGLDSISEDDKKDIIEKWTNNSVVKEVIDYTLLLKIMLVVILLMSLLVYRQKIIKNKNKELRLLVEEKTRELKEINENLEKKIKEEVEKTTKREKQLYESVKMAQMGEIIGNIAHQWRQPLSMISTSAGGLQLEKDFGVLDDEKFKKYTDGIIEHTEYLSKTIDIFRNYIEEKAELKDVILQDRINSAISIVEASFKNSNIKIENNITTEKPIEIRIVVGELSQVIINILNNARDILIQRDISNPWVKVDLEYKEKNIILLKVEDNGGGIDNGFLSKIFDPYFTTKHKSQGTGLGLHMSKRIIEKHLHGKMYVENSNNGALFTIELPIK